MVAVAPVTLSLVEKHGNKYLKFDFDGHLTEQAANEAIVEWKKTLDATPGNLNVIYNCIAMTGFETQARKNWQAMMGVSKERLGSMWVISHNVFILGAAKTMGLLTGFTIKVAKEESAIKD